MAKDRKSPQEKKYHEYTKDHFTFGWHSSRMFPKTWKKKKRSVNREYRQKSEQLISKAKSGLSAEEVSEVVEELTPSQLKSVLRRRLRKTGTVTVGEKVQRKLDTRQRRAGRRVHLQKFYDESALAAVHVLVSLQGDALVAAVRRAYALCSGASSSEIRRIVGSRDPLDRALLFLRAVVMGSANEIDALRRNPALQDRIISWVNSANRILKQERPATSKKSAPKFLLQTLGVPGMKK